VSNQGTEPVMSTYMEKWAKVDIVAHEQERSAREEYSRDCIDWQRIEINRLMSGIEEICQHRATPPNVRARLRHMVAGVDWRKVRE
jgi:hypothetical protein